MINIKNIISAIYKRIFLHPYYDTGTCPYCGSLATGRILQIKFGMNALGETINHMEKGEFVRFVHGNLGRTCFCHDCHSEWKGLIEKKWITSTQFFMKLEEKGLSEEYISNFEVSEKNIIRKNNKENIIKKIILNMLPFNDIAGTLKDTRNELLITPFIGLSTSQNIHTNKDDSSVKNIMNLEIIDTDGLDQISDKDYGELTEEDEQLINSILEGKNGQ